MSVPLPPPTFGLLCFATGGTISAGTMGAPPQLSPSGGTPVQTAGPCLPEIHLNIWERQENKESKSPDSFLDIGLMLDLDDPTATIELVFPERVRLESIEDLSKLVSQPKAIPAIFNESWAVSSGSTQGADTIVYDPAGSDIDFAIVGTGDALSEATHGNRSALSISVPKLISRARNLSHILGRSVRRVYIRFRILNFRRDFYCVGNGERTDGWWQPSWQRTEDIDFRLNVRRGAPPGLERDIGRFLEFSKVHLFLMRSRSMDIIFQDALFKSSRSLEDEDFWANYSLTPPMSLEGNLKRVKGSLGYQWKKTNRDGPIKEFGTLARFKIVEFGVGKFVVVALLVGALGNAVYDGGKEIFLWARAKICADVHSESSGTNLTQPESNPPLERSNSTAKPAGITNATRNTK